MPKLFTTTQFKHFAFRESDGVPEYIEFETLDSLCLPNFEAQREWLDWVAYIPLSCFKIVRHERGGRVYLLHPELPPLQSNPYKYNPQVYKVPITREPQCIIIP